MEERNKCKLCSRSFSNGRALGGHMKSHLATFPLPPAAAVARRQLGGRDSVSSSSVVQDRESETESKNPTRRRSKRTRRSRIDSPPPRPSCAESPEPASSVSDTSPEEDVAICLVMLSMDKSIGAEKHQTPESKKSTAAAGVSLRCEKCRKSFRSGRALCGHRKICRNEDEEEEEENGGNWKIFKCPYCCKVFGSGQALGGHKRSHLQGSMRTAINGSSSKVEIGLDLNLPAPLEEDDYSVVSEA